jgi:hypothetical protein
MCSSDHRPAILRMTAIAIKSSSRAVLIKESSAGRCGAFRNVVKGEADHGGLVEQPKAIDAQIHRQPMTDFRFGFRPGCAHVSALVQET